MLSIVDFILRKVLTVRPLVKIGFYLLIVTSASVIGDIARPKPSYFSDKKNVFNQYFVKLGWGWSLANVSAFLLLANLIEHRGKLEALARPICRELLLTTYWYICTHSFEWLENFTGSCSNSKLSSKRPCLRDGHDWLGFDISGHTFLLVHCLLFINEESGIVHRIAKKLDEQEREHHLSRDYPIQPSRCKRLLRIVSFVLLFFTFLWEFMLLCTALYFHTTAQKLLGMAFAIGGWFLVYRLLKI